MTTHSIKVCRLYKITASIIEEVIENGGSVKELIYKKKHPNIKAIYALVNETLRHASILNELINSTQILIKEPRFNPWLARVLITELLWGKKRLSGEAKPIQTTLSYQKELEKYLLNISDKKEAPKSKVIKPRYVRINTLIISIHDAIDGFINEGWNFVQNTHNDYNNFLSMIANLEEDQFTTDLHVPDLLIFPPKTQFHNHDSYLNGILLLQDKASCLPALLLNPSPNSNVIDMCAAPGMKTTQLAAMMNNQGLLYAVEKNKHRYQTLCTLVEKAKASCVKLINEDVLNLTAEECNDVEYILVDPSCSGSGIIDRINITNNEENYSAVRLRKLASFQIKVLCHALTNFPKVKRVVYSTCSIFSQENEEVIENALKICKDFRLINAKKNLGDKWNNTSSDKYDHIGNNCLYAYSDSDFTNGFFVAVFEKCTNSNAIYSDILEKNKCKTNFDEIVVSEKQPKTKIKKNEFKSTPAKLNEDIKLKLTEKKENITSKKVLKKEKYVTECSQAINNIERDVVDSNKIVTFYKENKKKKKNRNKCTNEMVELIEENYTEIPSKRKKYTFPT